MQNPSRFQGFQFCCLTQVIGNNVLAGLNEVSGEGTFSYSRFSSDNQKPLIFLLEPVVYFIENPRSTCKAAG
jgi:hypothetical protein